MKSTSRSHSHSHSKLRALPPLAPPLAAEAQPRDKAAAASHPPSVPLPSASASLPSKKPKKLLPPLATSAHPRQLTLPANMQGDAPESSDASAAALDKKRNKLGYHRTSVACAHCRRRKIRCLTAPEDPQGRCQNCIRLKKDCNFIPVDQQPMGDRSRRPATMRDSSRASSSSAPNSALSPDHVHQYPAHMPMGYPPSLPAMHGSMPIAPIETGAYQTPLRSATWDQQYMESPLSAGGQMSDVGTPGFWKSSSGGDYSSYNSQPESARSAHFPGPFTSNRQASWPHGLPPSQHPTPVHTLASSSQTPLQPQPRSMSLQHESSSGIYGPPSQIPEGPYYDPRGPPSLYASTGSPATSVSLSDGTSAPGQTQSAAMHYSVPGQQSWDPSKAGMEYGAPHAWYPDPSHSAHAPEGSQSWSHNPGG